MENHVENSIYQEIIDSLAKKVIDLEKRQAKVEGLNMAELPSKVQELESIVTTTTDMRILENTKQIQKFDSLLNGFDTKLDAIPTVIPIKHEFDPKSRFVIKIVLGLTLGVSILLATAITEYMGGSQDADEANKFLIVRGFYPEIANYIDSAYVTNKDLLIRKAKVNIGEKQNDNNQLGEREKIKLRKHKKKLRK